MNVHDGGWVAVCVCGSNSRGPVDQAAALLLEKVRNAAVVEKLIAYLEKRRGYILDYQQWQRAELWIASTRVEQYDDWAVSG